MPQNQHVLLTFEKVHNPLRLPRKMTSERPKVLRTPQFFALLTSKCASRHKGVQFFNSHLARWLRTRRFSEPTFDPPEPQIIGNTQCSAAFLPFRASASSFF